MTDDHRLILHHRDDIPTIAHPDCWAGFGGAVEEGETVEEAVKREVVEETGIAIPDPIFLTSAIDQDGDGRLVSLFYLVGGIGVGDIDLQEGTGVGVFSIAELDGLKIAAFIRTAIASELVPALAARRV